MYKETKCSQQPKEKHQQEAKGNKEDYRSNVQEKKKKKIGYQSSQ